MFLEKQACINRGSMGACSQAVFPPGRQFFPLAGSFQLTWQAVFPPGRQFSARLAGSFSPRQGEKLPERRSKTAWQAGLACHIRAQRGKNCLPCELKTACQGKKCLPGELKTACQCEKLPARRAENCLPDELKTVCQGEKLPARGENCLPGEMKTACRAS